MFFVYLFKNRTFGDKRHRFVLHAECHFCHQQCQSTEGNSRVLAPIMEIKSLALPFFWSTARSQRMGHCCLSVSCPTVGTIYNFSISEEFAYDFSRRMWSVLMSMCVCVFVCLYIHSSISETTWTNFTKLVCCLQSRVGPLLLSLWYISSSSFVDDVTFLHNGPYGVSHVFLSSQRIV